jgi:hypothetical protein
MKSIKIAFALCFGSMMLATIGCGPSKALLSAQEYEKASCACKDVACVTDATKKFGERSKTDAATASASEAEAITKATTAATECMTKVTMASVPGMPAMPKH